MTSTTDPSPVPAVPPAAPPRVPLRLTKHHGLGNDFLVALVDDNPAVVPSASIAREVCDRHRGIGADGLLWGSAPADPAHDLAMVLHNSDGSVAEISGNGIRCLGQAFLRSRGRDRGELTVETEAGLRRLVVTATDEPDTVHVRVDMGDVAPGPPPPNGLPGRHVSLSVGNPHLVIEVDSLAGVDVASVGASLEAQVPGGVNVHFLSIDGVDRIAVRHWERGAGVTEACGSGAVCSAVAAHRWGLVGTAVTVAMPGGSATVDVDETGGRTSASLTGPATFVGEVTV